MGDLKLIPLTLQEILQVEDTVGATTIISKEAMDDDDSSWDQYSITGPNMAGGGMIRGPSYLSGGIGSLGSTYLR